MSFEKRPRPLHDPAAFIDLTRTDNDKDYINDEGPPRKRHKSTTPGDAAVIRKNNAKPIFAGSTKATQSSPPTVNQHNPKYLISHGFVTKTSPWKNRPSWQPQYSTSQSSKNLNRTQEVVELTTKGWTKNDDQLLRSLSLSQPEREVKNVRDNAKLARPQDAATPSDGHSDNEKERENMVAAFKLNKVTPLKFNPNNLLSKPWQKDRGALEGQLASSQVKEGNSSNHIHRPTKSLSIGPGSVAGTAVKTSLATPHISVNVPLRPTPPIRTSSSSTSQSTSIKASGLGPAKPGNSRKFLVNVPLVGETKWKQERKALQEKLKNGTEFAREHLEDVEGYLGLIGFSKEFPDDLDVERYRNAAQPKKRRVVRSEVLLDMGRSESERTTSKIYPVEKMIHPREQIDATLTARFAQHVSPPLTFSNTVNDRRLNGKFQFVSDYILRKGVKATGSIGHPGCHCAVGCGISCLCLLKKFNERTKAERTEYVPQYERHTSGLTVLRSDFINRHRIVAPREGEGDISDKPPQERAEISECSGDCSCGSSCMNRVVQIGRTVPLEIFETDRCGFGVRSSKNLIRGQFIDVYLGEVITEHELDRREAAAEAGSTSYIYSLDWFQSHQQCYHIDGEKFGSAMRFVNHSCDPNAGTFPVLNNNSTRQLHYVAFFALKDIPAGTEITIDYTPQDAGQMYELKATDEGMEQCHCGARNCRRMLWRPGKERRARKKTVGRVFD